MPKAQQPKKEKTDLELVIEFYALNSNIKELEAKKKKLSEEIKGRLLPFCGEETKNFNFELPDGSSIKAQIQHKEKITLPEDVVEKVKIVLSKAKLNGEDFIETVERLRPNTIEQLITQEHLTYDEFNSWVTKDVTKALLIK